MEAVGGDSLIPEGKAEWYEDESDNEPDTGSIDQYDLTVSPNDFNTRTMFDFLRSGAIVIPGFQRNYVWDIRRASKLIESLIIGLPVPQVFLYEEERNRFLVIDGQQRLMSIYYFMEQRFPRLGKRPELRQITQEFGRLPDDVLHDDKYFEKFSLKLPRLLDNSPNRFSGLNYQTLGDYKTSFDLRTIRNIIVKQVQPDEDDSAMYEIFNRLNTGGVNLTPQEIRSSLYHSNFYSMLFRINVLTGWRRFLGVSEPDIHAKDIEFLLRGFAMLIDGEKYKPSMSKFLNGFSKRARQFTPDFVTRCEAAFGRFLKSSTSLADDAFRTQTNKFSVTIFESVFHAVSRKTMDDERASELTIIPESIVELRQDPQFSEAASRGTANSSNVEARLRMAEQILRLA